MENCALEIPADIEVLRDIRISRKKKKKKIKVQPWAEHKENSRLLWQSFMRLHEEKKAWNLYHCGSYLYFKECSENCNTDKDHYKHLSHANFCRSRLCPMCNWRKSLVTFTQMEQIVRVAENRRKLRYIHLILTVKNVPSSQLSSEITKLLNGFKTLCKRKRVKDMNEASFRALEVTYNRDTGEYHPHLHVLIAVEPSYFKADGQAYISQPEWISLWKDCMELDYDPNVRVMAVKNKANIEKAIAELAKYAVKPSDYIFPEDKNLTDRVVCTLDGALKGRRLMSLGGMFKEIHKELNLKDIEEADLTHISEDMTEEVCPKCGGTLIEKSYAWDKNRKQYILSEVEEEVNFKMLELANYALRKNKYKKNKETPPTGSQQSLLC